MIYSWPMKLSLYLRVCSCVEDYLKGGKLQLVTVFQLGNHETQIKIKAQGDPQVT